MEEKAFHSILADYQKTHPGKYRNYPCPKCGAPISINFERSSHMGVLGYTDECTNPDCDYSWYDVCYT